MYACSLDKIKIMSDRDVYNIHMCSWLIPQAKLFLLSVHNTLVLLIKYTNVV